MLVTSGRSLKVDAKVKCCKNYYKSLQSTFGLDSSYSSWLWVPGADAQAQPFHLSLSSRHSTPHSTSTPSPWLPPHWAYLLLVSLFRRHNEQQVKGKKKSIWHGNFFDRVTSLLESTRDLQSSQNNWRLSRMLSPWARPSCHFRGQPASVSSD